MIASHFDCSKPALVLNKTTLKNQAPVKENYEVYFESVDSRCTTLLLNF